MKSWFRWSLGLLFTVQSLSAAKPNIIYILADDLGYGDLGCYGGLLIDTPRIDQMRKEGMKFTQHYAGSSRCAPTRSSLLTGMHTGHTRVRDNSGYLKKGRVPLLPEDVTIGEVLKQADYRTGVIGKWGVGEDGSTGTPNKQGFDFWFGYLNQTRAHYYYQDYLWKNEKKVLYPDNPTKRTHYSHDLMTDEALAFIDRNQKKPFFLYMAYTIPHVDLDVPEDSKKPYIGKLKETKPYGTPGGQHYRYEERPHATFAGMVSRLDRDVGRILDRLKKLGLEKNTLVIFTSDNGPTSAGGADPEFFDGNGPLRGIKFQFYEGGIRVPMIARWPGRIKAGTTSHHISAHWDMMSTFADLAGTRTSPVTDGISMAPSFLGKKQKPHNYLYWECYSSAGQQALRKGDWKALRFKVSRNKNGPVELYNLKHDLAETTNVAAKHPQIAAEMKKLMAEAHVPSADYAFKPMPAKKKKKK
ncbi:MAG: arylsulfatase [Limisphaerales bacterium]